MTDTSEIALVDAHLALGSLAQSWRWLTALLQPGTAVNVEALLSDNERARRNALVLAERAERYAGVRDGRSAGADLLSRRASGQAALSPSPTPARPAILDTRAIVRRALTDTCELVCACADAKFIGAAGGDDAAVTRMLVWLDRQLDPDTAAIALRGDEPAAVLAKLLTADRAARAVAGVTGEHRQAVDDECPACHRRSLYAELHDGATRDQDRSYVICSRPACRCAGAPSCTCGLRVRYRGARHVWRRGEWEDYRRQHPPARRTRPQVRSTTRGHGGWPDRRGTGPAKETA